MAYKKDSHSEIIKWGVIGLVALGAYKFFQPLIALGASKVSGLADAAQYPEYIKATGASADIVKIAVQIADTVFHALHDGLLTDDEPKAIDAMNGCKTLFQIKTVSTIYNLRHGYDLRSDFRSYVHSNDVDPLFGRPLTAVNKQYFGF